MSQVFYGKVRKQNIFLLDWLTFSVNEILGDHNVDKQMTDSRGDVSCSSPAP